MFFNCFTKKVISSHTEYPIVFQFEISLQKKGGVIAETGHHITSWKIMAISNYHKRNIYGRIFYTYLCLCFKTDPIQEDNDKQCSFHTWLSCANIHLKNQTEGGK